MPPHKRKPGSDPPVPTRNHPKAPSTQPMPNPSQKSKPKGDEAQKPKVLLQDRDVVKMSKGKGRGSKKLDEVEKVEEQEQVDIPDPGGIHDAKRGSPKKRRIGRLTKQPKQQEPYHQGRGEKNPTGMLTRWRKKGMAAEKEKSGISQKERKEERPVMREAEGLERDHENEKSAEEQCDVKIGEDERLEDREEGEGWDNEDEKDENNDKEDMEEKNKENEDKDVDMIQGEKESSIAELGQWEQT